MHELVWSVLFLQDYDYSKTVSVAFKQEKVDRTAEVEFKQQLRYEEEILKPLGSSEQDDSSEDENGFGKELI